MRPSDPVLLFVAQLSSPKKVTRTSQPARRCMQTEVESNPILKSCEEEQRRPMPTQLEHVPRRKAARGPPARSHGAESGERDWSVQRKDDKNDETAAAMTLKNRQRDVSESLAQQ